MQKSSFAVGDAVEGNFEGSGEWYRGKVTKIKRHRYDIAYDDGDTEQGVKADMVRPLTTKTTSSKRGGQSRRRVRDAAPPAGERRLALAGMARRGWLGKLTIFLGGCLKRSFSARSAHTPLSRPAPRATLTHV